MKEKYVFLELFDLYSRFYKLIFLCSCNFWSNIGLHFFKFLVLYLYFSMIQGIHDFLCHLVFSLLFFLSFTYLNETLYFSIHFCCYFCLYLVVVQIPHAFFLGFSVFLILSSSFFILAIMWLRCYAASADLFSSSQFYLWYFGLVQCAIVS